MNTVGIAYIMERKETIIDGNIITYYECIDVVCGFYYDFKEDGKTFIPLSKNQENPIPKNNTNKIQVAGFQTLDELCTKNNNQYDFEKFMDDCKENVGYYYFYDPSDTYKFIRDPELIDKIKSSNKKYDMSILNEQSNISQKYSAIKKTIVAQDEPIMKILTTLFKNQTVIHSDFDLDLIAKLKENILICGPTGTGKTEILKRISKLYQIPIVIEDATALSETGYMGREVENMLQDLYLAADKDIELAQKGILVIDEFDKLAEKKQDGQTHISRIGVQRSLLKILDGSLCYFDTKKFDTSKLTIVLLGAFDGIIKDSDYSQLTPEDFNEYGIMRELIGRISKIIPMNALSKDDIKKILVESDFSPLNTYKKLFEYMNLDFHYNNEFIDYVAERAIQLNTGARSLKTIVDDCMSSAMFKIFAGEYSEISLVAPKSDDDIPYILSKKLK